MIRLVLANIRALQPYTSRLERIITILCIIYHLWATSQAHLRAFFLDNSESSEKDVKAAEPSPATSEKDVKAVEPSSEKDAKAVESSPATSEKDVNAVQPSPATFIPVALLGLTAFLIEIAAQLAKPPPVAAAYQYTGRITFLTVQTNCIGCLYFLGVVASSFGIKSERLNLWLRRLFPLMFSLGTFLTIAYYGLVHFNAKNVAAWEEKYKAGDKFVYALQHLEHIFALPMVFLYASYFQLPSPPRSDVVFYTGGFAFFYVCFAVVINKLTDDWLYNVFGDVEAAGGVPCAAVHVCVLN